MQENTGSLPIDPQLLKLLGQLLKVDSGDCTAVCKVECLEFFAMCEDTTNTLDGNFVATRQTKMLQLIKGV